MVGLPRTRHRHDRAQLRVARERNVLRWRRYRARYIDRRWSPLLPGDWWTQEGRFYKLSPSCDCGMCRCARAERRFRSHKRRVYRQMDRVEALAW